MIFSALSVTAALALTAYGPGVQDPPTPGAKADSVKLTRIYAEGEKNKYEFKVNADMGGQSVRIDAEVLVEIKKLLADGSAETQFKMGKVKAVLPDGMPSLDDIPAVTVPCDASSMMRTIDVNDGNWPFIVLNIAGFVPNKEIEVGRSFPVDWKDTGGSFQLSGSLKLRGLSEFAGEKAAELTGTLTGQPNDGSGGKITMTSFVSVVTGKLLKSSGKVELDEGVINFTIAIAK